MKSASILLLMALASLVLLSSPFLPSGFPSPSYSNCLVFDLEGGDDDKSERTSLESFDEIFYPESLQWMGIAESKTVKLSVRGALEVEDYISDIAYPPPRI